MPWECKQSDDEILEAVVRLGAERGGRLKLFEFCDAVGVSPATINRRFGGWMKLRQRAGFAAARSFSSTPVGARRFRMILALRRAVAKLGVELSLAEFCEHAMVSSQTVQRLFGSWRRLREEAGYRPRTSLNRISAEQLLVEVRRIHRWFGFFPTAKEIQQYGRYPGRLYQKHFRDYAGLQRAYEKARPWMSGEVVPGEDHLLSEEEARRLALGRRPYHERESSFDDTER